MNSQKRIAIVEDEPLSAKLLKARLEKEGFEVAVAVDAYQGTQMIMHGRFDLIILDLIMPAGGGFAILERIRNIPQLTTTPVIILTGKEIDGEIQRQAEAHSVSALFHKPVSSNAFISRVHELLSA